MSLTDICFICKKQVDQPILHFKKKGIDLIPKGRKAHKLCLINLITQITKERKNESNKKS